MAKLVPIVVPRVETVDDLRQITATKLNDLSTRIAQSNQRNEDMSMGGNRVTDLSDPATLMDAVNLKTLRKHIEEIGNTGSKRQVGAGFYTIVFSANQVVSGQACPPYIVQPHRQGSPSLVKLAATGTGSANALLNIAINGVNILTSDIVLGSGSHGPVSSAVFVTPLPHLDTDDLVTAVVSTSGGISFATIELEVQP